MENKQHPLLRILKLMGIGFGAFVLLVVVLAMKDEGDRVSKKPEPPATTRAPAETTTTTAPPQVPPATIEEIRRSVDGRISGASVEQKGRQVNIKTELFNKQDNEGKAVVMCSEAWWILEQSGFPGTRVSVTASDDKELAATLTNPVGRKGAACDGLFNVSSFDRALRTDTDW